MFRSRPFPQKVERRGPASPWRRRHGRRRASTQEKKSGDWDDQSSDRELFKGLSRDRVLRRRVTSPRGSQAPRVHRKTTFFEVVVSHGYFDVLTYGTSQSVIDRVLESDVGNIFAQDTQRLENGNVRIPDVGILHKITAHVDPSRRCGELGDERNLQKCGLTEHI
jgi:hypothetical protein